MFSPLQLTAGVKLFEAEASCYSALIKMGWSLTLGTGDGSWTVGSVYKHRYRHGSIISAVNTRPRDSHGAEADLKMHKWNDEGTGGSTKPCQAMALPPAQSNTFSWVASLRCLFCLTDTRLEAEESKRLLRVWKVSKNQKHLVLQRVEVHSLLL